MDTFERNAGGVLVAALLTVGGYVAGAIVNPKPHRYVPPQPICGCTHHFSMHDDQGCAYSKDKKVLVEQSEPTIHVNELGGRTTTYGKERYEIVTVDCPCKRYAGPQHNPDPNLPGA